MRPDRSRFARAAGLLACVVILLLGFRWLAAELAAIHLAHDAGRVEQALREGRPRWHWAPRTMEDLVAGRIFGDGRAHPASTGLVITATGPKPFELGLPVAQRLDLAHWPVLSVDADGRAVVDLSVVWADGHGRACLTPPMRWQIGIPLRIDLRAQAAVNAHGQPCPLPIAATMLRLRIGAIAGRSWILRQVNLTSARPMASLPPDARPPATQIPVRTQLAELDGSIPSPRIWLPASASAEQLLAWRDDAVHRQAGALAVRIDRPPASPSWTLPRGFAWLASGTYVLILAWLARRPRGDGITLAAAFAGPLWLITGLQWGQAIGWPAVTAFGGALVFAGWTGWRGRIDRDGLGWTWIGRWTAAGWWAPLLLIPVAIAVGLGWGHPFEPIKPGRALVYLGWAALQQWLLLGFALPRLARILPGRPWVVLGAATLFALMHTPNGALMQLCLLAELYWAACFLRTRSLLPVALAHAASALIVGATLVGPVLRSLEVSARFFF